MLEPSPEGALLALRVAPGAKKNRIMGEHDGRLRVRLQAPPVEGKANKALLRFLARELGLRKNQVRLRRGERSRDKIVLLAGVPAGDAEERLRRILRGE
jgi:uncharacterized protein (TIGR00251 family)